MKKIFYLLAAIGVTWGIVSCDSEPKNPGDFSIKSTMEVGSIMSLVNGQTYNLKVMRDFDTIFKNGVQVWDTVFDANGEFVSRTADTIWVPAKHNTRYVEMEPVVFEAQADTFSLNLSTNAKWESPSPISSVPWIYNESTTAGGGDGTIIFRIARNRNFKRSTYTPMYIYTSDSTVFYKIPFGQKGEKDVD